MVCMLFWGSESPAMVDLGLYRDSRCETQEHNDTCFHGNCSFDTGQAQSKYSSYI